MLCLESEAWLCPEFCTYCSLAYGPVLCEAYIGGFLHFLYQFYSPAVFAVSKYMPLALRPCLGYDSTRGCQWFLGGFEATASTWHHGALLCLCLRKLAYKRKQSCDTDLLIYMWLPDSLISAVYHSFRLNVFFCCWFVWVLHSVVSSEAELQSGAKSSNQRMCQDFVLRAHCNALRTTLTADLQFVLL